VATGDFRIPFMTALAASLKSVEATCRKCFKGAVLKINLKYLRNYEVIKGKIISDHTASTDYFSRT
jgi:hypothetical protein